MLQSAANANGIGRVLFTLAILSLAGSPAAADPWLHVKVDEWGEDPATVRINLPLETVESISPALDHGDLSHGHLRIENLDVDRRELRAILEAVRDAEDGVYVTVDEPDENVRIAKEGEHFLVEVEELDEEGETVHIKVRMELIEALLSGPENELNLAAALTTLRRHSGEDLVIVQGDTEKIRIWVDDKKTID